MQELAKCILYLLNNPASALSRRLIKDWRFEYGRQRGGKLKLVGLNELFPTPTRKIRYVNYDMFYREEGHVYKAAPFQSIENTQVLCLLVNYLAPARVLEIGTHVGLTTMNMHLNAPPDCEMHTVDINPLVKSVPFIDAYFNGHGIKLHTLKSEDLAFQDLGLFDFIFIDGDHSYEGVRKDTELALKLLAPKGTIVWDDYGFSLTEDLTRCLDEFSSQLNILHIDQTSLAIYRSNS